MTKAIRIHEGGGPEAMRWESVELAEPGPGEVRLRHTAIGLNYIDTYHRSGLYPVPLPTVLGMEGAGVVDSVGPDVADLSPGDRVAYCDPIGSYAEARNAPAARLVKLPEGISDEIAAAVMLKGLTAHYLLRSVYPVGEDTVMLFHAAAGGVGLIACQWAKALGAMVIGTVGSAEKAALARDHGASHTINYREEDFVARVADITEGAKCHVVYDSVGKDTFMRGFDCLRPRGMMVSYGQSSGMVEPFQTNLLAAKGSLFLTRPTLFTYMDTTENLRAAAKDLFGLIADGTIRIEIGQRFALSDAAEAHRALEGRQTTGSTLLIP